MVVARVSLAGLSLSEEDLQKLYVWVDGIPLSRPKRNIGRDFADAVLVAEVVAHFFPNLVELHNYSAANSLQQKSYNWNTLQQKVFRKLGFLILPEDVDGLSQANAGAIERLLHHLQFRLAAYKQRMVQRQQQAQLTTGPEAGSSGSRTPGFAPSRDQYAAPGGALMEAPSGLPAANGGENGQGPRRALHREVDADLLLEKEKRVQELSETVEILELKIAKLEQLLRLKDAKIERLMDSQSQAPRA